MSQPSLVKKEKKTETIQKFKTSATDTGSPEVQIALLTSKIVELTGHMKTHKKDFSTERGLLKLVGKRRNALDYLKNANPSRYLKLIESLNLRK